MQNNVLGTIAVSNTKRPRAFFNKSADLHTTMDFGSVIPAKVQRVIPNSKIVMQSSERMLLAPLVRPTMGRLSLKGYHNFVSMSDIWPNYAAMMSQEPIYRNGISFTPSILPNVSISELSLSVLFGARCTIYVWNGTSGSSFADLLDIDSSVSGFNPNVTSTWSVPQAGTAITDLMIDRSYNAYGLIGALRIPCHLLLGKNTASSFSYLPLSNSSLADLFNLDGNSDVVTPDGADVAIPLSIGSYYYLLCFRLSSFGKRLRKILIGCGYELNFNMDSRVTILPLLAFYKSYFDVFGLTLYNNWESTACSRYITLATNISNSNDLNHNLFISNGGHTSSGCIRDFLFTELGFCIYTDEQDFVSSHIRSTAVSPNASGFINSINTDVDETSSFPGRPHIDSNSVPFGQPPDLTSPNGHSYISDVLHGQLDSELLKRLYRWTNRNTIAGRRIAELLRAQGLGAYVDECKSNFIGSFELPIEIYDVPSQSDTFSDAGGSAEGMRLGEYGARGIAQNQERPFEFETNEDGYWITLFTVVPKGGYSEAFDPTVFATDKWSQYNPEFDSLGYEADRKALVQGSQPFASDPGETSKLSDSFGYVPRYFSWKFGRNVINGDFSRRGSRSAYAPFMLERLIDVGDREVTDVDQQSGATRYYLRELFKPSSLPIAGDVWRYPTRYPWIGQFNRIFYYEGDKQPATLELSNFVTSFEFFSNQEDNFILHTIFNVREFAPMLPVEDSFETYDDDNAVNGSMGKA